MRLEYHKSEWSKQKPTLGGDNQAQIMAKIMYNLNTIIKIASA